MTKVEIRKGNSDEKSAPLLWRAARYVIWMVRRKVWEGLRILGITLPAKTMLSHPLDQKVGLHIAEGNKGPRCLVICDFSAFPLSYDIVVLLAVADDFRRRSGCMCLDVVFLAHDADPFMREAFQSNPANISASYRTFIFNLGIEATLLFEGVGDVHFFTNRSMLETFWRKAKSTHRLFPKEYTPFRPSYLPDRKGVPYYGLRHLFESPTDTLQALSLRPPGRQLDLAQAWIKHHVGERKAITITIRETPHQPERNSNVEEWQLFVDLYANEGIIFIVLRDYYALYSRSPIVGENVVECPEAVQSISFRAAIYEMSYLNLFTGNGPAMLCFLNPRTRYLVFRICTDAASSRPEELLFQHGLNRGDSMPGSTTFQKLVWEDDNVSVLARELNDMVEKIEAS